MKLASGFGAREKFCDVKENVISQFTSAVVVVVGGQLCFIAHPLLPLSSASALSIPQPSTAPFFSFSNDHSSSFIFNLQLFCFALLWMGKFLLASAELLLALWDV
jgi:hypothetical protein